MLEPDQVVSIGTGWLRVGAWACEVAKQYPTALVHGLDLSPVQPEVKPDNCFFLVGNATEDLECFQDGSFDLVHSRSVSLIDSD